MLTGTILIAAALTLIVLGNRLVRNDEILGLAAYISSIVMAVGGLFVVPSITSISLGLLALGWLQLRTPKV